MKFNHEVFMQSLQVMGKGMLSIFVVIFVLTLIVIIMSKVTNMKIFKKDEQD